MAINVYIDNFILSVTAILYITQSICRGSQCQQSSFNILMFLFHVFWRGEKKERVFAILYFKTVFPHSCYRNSSYAAIWFIAMCLICKGVGKFTNPEYHLSSLGTYFFFFFQLLLFFYPIALGQSEYFSCHVTQPQEVDQCSKLGSLQHHSSD